MKKLLLQTLLFLLPLAAFFAFAVYSLNGQSDHYYLRFTTPTQSSLILGASRAAQGLQPEIFNQQLNRNDIYNYAFTLTHSPYGPGYLRSIKRKVTKGSKNGIFILCVDPWSVACIKGFENDTALFRERDYAVYNTQQVAQNPNWEYLHESFASKPFMAFSTDTTHVLHADGWLEVSVPMDSLAQAKRKKNRLDFFTEQQLPFYTTSALRMASLEETVLWLKMHGKVFLVRLPVGDEMLAMDNAIDPNFNAKMEAMANRTGSHFADFTALKEDCIFIDGNHLHKSSGKKVSAAIARWIEAF